MRLALGRLLEGIGLVLLPVGLLLGLKHGNVRAELAYLGVGAGLFLIGYLLERPFRR